MATQASLDGIAKFGRAWRYRIHLSLPFLESIDVKDLGNLRDWVAVLQQLYDKLSGSDDLKDIFLFRREYIALFIDLLNAAIKDLETAGTSDIWDDNDHAESELNYILNRLFDTADYYRVLISPPSR